MSIEPDATFPSSRFVTTHWSIVLSAKAGLPGEADEALEQLCKTYWWPLYTFVRRRGYGAHDAQDLTQEFFARLLAKDFLRAVERSKGRFRSFLLASLEHFVANEWRNAHTHKRGGEFTFVSTDGDPEQQYLRLSGSSLSPLELFDQQWAMTLLNEAILRLQKEFVAAGKKALFESTKIYLTGEKQTAPYAELAAKLNMTEGALKMAVSRMRQRYGELLLEGIARTVNDPKDIEDELHALFAVFSH
ncbi:MAG TPA: sigma-70 family RNA polymerase sigma factor [Candidatus Saccharimonadales bacterium]|nr:sigma-70 family RNA polymerase sigma factor [Candidatus Saccharimonadales bacterium]